MTTKFIIDEEEALKKAFADSIAKDKLFDLNKWKKQREIQRIIELSKGKA